MSRCGAESEQGSTCVLPEGQHRQHWDRTIWWENTSYQPPPSRTPPGRARADRVSRRAHDLMHEVSERTPPEGGTDRTVPAREWDDEAWMEHAVDVMGEFLASRTEPFTTPEHLWPLLHDPAPLDRRVVGRKVQRLMTTSGLVREVGQRRLRDKYYTADGTEFKMNKIVPIYQVVGR